MTGKQRVQDQPSEFHSSSVNPSEVAKQFRKSGYTVLRDVFDQTFIDLLRTEFLSTFEHQLIAEQKSDALTVGDKRFKYSLPLQSPFDSTELLANPLLLPVLRTILGEALVLASVVCVTSLPGAQSQRHHRDHPNLFGTPIDHMLPSYAVKLLIPLVPMNEVTGTTRVWPQSQNNNDRVALNSTSVDPLLNPGDCMLTDYTLLHQGLANSSAEARPVLFLSYARSWFQDELNFGKQAHIVASQKTREKLLAEDGSLFSRVQSH